MTRTDHWYPTGTLAEPYEPQPVSDLTLIFPADVAALLPPAADIPDQFGDHHNDWCVLANRWFFDGLPVETTFETVDGVDGELAWRHLRAIMGSYQPKHEYKEAAVAYLMSLWFTSVTLPA